MKPTTLTIPIILCVLLWVACSTDSGEQKEPTQFTSIGEEPFQESAEIQPSGIIFPSHTLIDLDSSAPLPNPDLTWIHLYDPDDQLADSLCVLWHQGLYFDIYQLRMVQDRMQKIKPHPRDRYAYSEPGQPSHTGLIYTSFEKDRYQVLVNSDPEAALWIHKKDIETLGLEAYTWDDYFRLFGSDRRLALPNQEELIVYQNKALTQELTVLQKEEEHYVRILEWQNDRLKVRTYQSQGGKYAYPYTPDLEKDSLEGWISLLSDEQLPNLEFTDRVFQHQPKLNGIGFLSGPFIQYNTFANRPWTPAEDSIPIYDQSRSKIIGRVPVREDALHTYEASIEVDGEEHRYYASDLDRSPGLTSMEYLKVYDKKGSKIRMFAGEYKDQETWIDLDDLNPTYQYHTWLEYFQKFPEGNESWKTGYALIRGQNLHTEPSEESPVVLDLPYGFEIYLTGNYRDNWAEVTVKEVTYHYGETYFERKETFHEWKGWMKIVDDEGYPLLDEIVLGC